MNWGRMFTRPKVPVFVRILVVSFTSMAFGAAYPGFDLPANKPAEVPAISFSSSRFSLQGKNVQWKAPSIDATLYVSQKETFLAEKRDEAVKILRQQLDAGLSNNRDNLLLRLGQLLAEKYMELSYRENEIFSNALAENKKKEKSPKLDNTRSQRYLKDALSVFNTLEKEFPNHPKIDEITYFIGFVELEQGNEKRGVRYLERVVQLYPKSRKFDEALVHLGDHYFEKHKLGEALARFSALASRKTSPLYHYARYKLAWCELNRGRPRQGLDTLKKLVVDLSDSNEPAKFNLRTQTLKDMVAFFAEVEAVEEAMSFYQAQVGKEAAAENIKLIADMLRVKARDESAVRAYEKVLTFYGDTLEAPKAEVAIFEALLRLGRTGSAISRFTIAIAKYAPDGAWVKRFENQPGEPKPMMTDLESQAEKAALFFHQSAQKSANKTSFRHALTLYEAILKHFPTSPSFKKIAFYRAEILFNQGRWFEAADGYMQAAKVAPKDKLSDEAVYNALFSLDRVTARADSIERYSKDQQKLLNTTAEEIPEHETRFLKIADYYLKEYPQGERVVDVRFRMGAIYYRHKHFGEALEIFKTISLQYPKHRTATTSAHLVLDIYNIQKNYEKLNAVATEFADVKGLGDAEFRAEVGDIISQISFKEIERFEKDGDWETAGEKYFAFFQSNPKGKLAPDSLYNALVSYEKLNDVDKISEITKLYLSRFPESDHSKRVMLLSAKLSERTYDIETAQRVYERFFQKFPKDSEASKALFNAAVFAELLEHNKRALELYDQYLKLGLAPPDEQISIRISQAKLYGRLGQWDRVSQIYRRLSNDAKSPEERLAYLGELSRQFEKGGKLREREALLREISQLYDTNKKMRSGPGIQFVAEAKFRELQKMREKFDAVTLRFPPEDLIYSLKKKQRLLTQLVKGYDKVVEFGVPDWGVAALYEKSQCFENFVNTYRAVKVPTKYKDQDRLEAEKAIADIDTQLVKPLETKSSEVVKICAERAAAFHVVNGYAAKCNEKERDAASPGGIIPKANYWSTRLPGEEGVVRR